ncbi:MAG: hypothetical protein A3J94_04725 [Syntrophus sp. RIFOXYC2_FULL_54_9]|nr:MAG: hypothetical protein A2X92_07120 [Syntrophus sp. GWC2_56_31]OHE31906.1 MAG: hypothetical protein A3J94_04725 [Syntrophus sp. RIFOXYC2_FULL_54_9]
MWIAETFDQFVAAAYEEVCREKCFSLMKEGRMAFTAIGRWWDRNEEADIVALDEEGGTAWFGECKWSRNKVGIDVYEDLVRKAGLVTWRAGVRRDRFILFSRSGFTEAMTARALQDGVLLK